MSHRSLTGNNEICALAWYVCLFKMVNFIHILRIHVDLSNRRRLLYSYLDYFLFMLHICYRKWLSLQLFIIIYGFNLNLFCVTQFTAEPIAIPMRLGNHLRTPAESSTSLLQTGILASLIILPCSVCCILVISLDRPAEMNI